MDNQRFNQTLHFHYQHPKASAVEDALRWWVSSNHSMMVGFHENPCNVVLYAFVRLGQLYPELLRRYESQFDDAHPWGQRFLSRVLAHVGDGDTEAWAHSLAIHDANDDIRLLASGQRHAPIQTLPIVSPVQFDLHWMDFFLTGKQQPLEEISGCLYEPSIVRSRLEQWLAKPGILPWLIRWRRNRQVNQLEDEMGIVCNGEKVLNLEDLDCLLIQDEGFGNIAYCDISYAVRFLPVWITLQEQLRIGIKMMAKWSLFSNALQHPKVREFCNKQHEQSAGALGSTLFGHLSFLDIAINLEMAQGNSEEALRLAESFMRLDPYSRRVEALVNDLSAKKTLRELMTLAVPISKVATDKEVRSTEILAQCIEQSMQADSYYTLCQLQIDSDEDSKEVEWQLTYEKPERFEVFQKAGDNYDRWFTIDGRSFHELHLLAQKVPDNAWDGVPINKRLRIESVLDCLGSLRVRHFQLDKEQSLDIIAGNVSDIPELAREHGAPADAECQLVVWISSDKGEPKWLKRFHLQAGPLCIEQTFSGFNEAHISREAFG